MWQQIAALDEDYRVCVNEFGVFIQKRRRPSTKKYGSGSTQKAWNTIAMYKSLTDATIDWHRNEHKAIKKFRGIYN